MQHLQEEKGGQCGSGWGVTGEGRAEAGGCMSTTSSAWAECQQSGRRLGLRERVSMGRPGARARLGECRWRAVPSAGERDTSRRSAAGRPPEAGPLPHSCAAGAAPKAGTEAGEESAAAAALLAMPTRAARVGRRALGHWRHAQAGRRVVKWRPRALQPPPYPLCTARPSRGEMSKAAAKGRAPAATAGQEPARPDAPEQGCGAAARGRRRTAHGLCAGWAAGARTRGGASAGVGAGRCVLVQLVQVGHVLLRQRAAVLHAHRTLHRAGRAAAGPQRPAVVAAQPAAGLVESEAGPSPWSMAWRQRRAAATAVQRRSS